ncbi:MAG: hypothetical protein JKX84_08185, partial [Flavobacteriales bacterium]|nr:hypothetical protein [Flavobacteriales bacterium]
AWIFYGLVKETIFLGKANNFISENLEIEGTEIISKKITYTDTISRIDIFIMGEPIAQQTQEQLQRVMLQKGIENTVLRIHQPKDVTSDIAGRLTKEVKVGILEDLYERNEELIAGKNAKILQLENLVINYQRDAIPFERLNEEVKTLYPNVQKMAYAVSVEMNGAKVDTIPTFMLEWKSGQSVRLKAKDKKVLQVWLKQRLELDTLRIVEF